MNIKNKKFGTALVTNSDAENFIKNIESAIKEISITYGEIEDIDIQYIEQN